jgi:hypothetical protein
MDNNRKNEWVENVLNSTEGYLPATPPDGLYRILEQRINIPVGKGRVISMNWVSAAAACVLLLISVNVYMANRHTTISKHQTDQVNELVQYYDITNDKEIGGI